MSMIHRSPLISSMLIGLSVLPLASRIATAEPVWPQWRGPKGMGHANGTGYPVHWSATEHVVWKADLPGRGWSSPVVDAETVWMTTAIEFPASKEAAARRLKTNTGDQPLNVLEKVELRALGVNISTGALTHNVLLMTVAEPQWVHQLNSYASPTPALGNGRLFCHFGALGTACVDTKAGSVLWKNSELSVMHENGPGSSPVLWKNSLIFHMDGSDKQFIAALDASSGKMLWKTERTGEMHSNPQLKKSYGTPLILPINGKEQLVSPASNWLYSYDETGKELWRLSYGGLGFSLTPRPVVGDGMLFMSTGFMKPELLAIRLEGAPQPEIVWKCSKGVPTMPSPILADSELYFVNDGGILTCLDAKSGAEIYRERLGGEFSSSPTIAEGRIYISNREGLTTVVKCGRKFEVLARNQLPGKIMASLAADNHSLFLRTDSSLWRLAEKK